jgi:hypothetical protein
MRITKRSLRRLIREAIDVINVESGEVLTFGDSERDVAPDAAVPDLMRRLGIDYESYASDENEYALPDDAWLKVEDETLGKQDARYNKKAFAKSKADAERLDIDNLLQRLRHWAEDAAQDYMADNPGQELQDIAYDLADAAEYEFERDEWDELLWHFDNDAQSLKVYTAESMG